MFRRVNVARLDLVRGGLSMSHYRSSITTKGIRCPSLNGDSETNEATGWECYSPNNERVKRRYVQHLKNVRGFGSVSIDQFAKAIARFEEYTKSTDFAEVPCRTGDRL